ncbi:MAG: BspA family leucine-rich repeat surface protein [Clostridiales bacterium]|nr:BspA family leucine-rich repeat surface protein [Clostridiales bacterium]MDD7036124.1 BspA family leucine-rich repeat surface protein [Bacillota bacterium]MDY2920149.1 BspA family leucine-rich repeat surface protein [Lentihominibacter sp.]
MEDYQVYNGIFENWKVARQIGKGGYGTVYELQKNEGAGIEKSALKVIPIPQSDTEIKEKQAEGRSDEYIKRYFHSMTEVFLNEHRIMAELRGNENIVGYEDHKVIPHDDGIGCDIFIRMELLTPMDDYLRGRAVTEDIIIKLGIDLCRALEACENKKIIHRDIKPSNIFISQNGNFKLGDFGVARTLEKTSGGMSKKGTYRYMAPEVYKGENYGRTVDIYSLGLVLYILANDRRMPFLSESAGDVTYEDEESALIRRIKGETIPAPRNVRANLASVILKACAYDPANRYSSAAQMRRDLENVRDNVPVQKPKPQPKPHTQTDKKKNKLIAAAITAAACIVFACSIFASGIGGSGGSGGSGKTEEEKTSAFPEKESTAVMMQDTGVAGTFGDKNGMNPVKLIFGEFERSEIEKIVFLDETKDAKDDAHDVSEAGNGEVLAWTDTGEQNSGLKTLYIAADGGVKANSDCNGLFAYCDNLRTVEFNGAFDTRDVTGMRYLFYHDKYLQSLDMEGIDTGNVTMMDRMFAFCGALRTIENMDFDTGKVEDMVGMFKGCNSLISVDTSTWDTSNVKEMWRMFEDCYSLRTVNTAGLKTGQVRGMQYMFYNCYALVDLDVSRFDTSQATNMYAMFSHCESLKTLDVSNFNTSNVTSMAYMFVSCKSAELIDVSNFNTSLLDGGSVKHIFYDCNPAVVTGYENWAEYDAQDSNKMFDLGE